MHRKKENTIALVVGVHKVCFFLIVDPSLFFEQGVEFLSFGLSTSLDLSLGYFEPSIFNVHLSIHFFNLEF